MHSGGRSMDQMMQYMILAAVLTVIFGGMFYYFGENLNIDVESQKDKADLLKRQAAEQLKLIDVMNSPLKVDVMNVGLEPIIIKQVFVDGNTASFTLTDMYGTTVTELDVNKIITVTPSITGTELQIITENNKIFSFD